MARVTVEDCIDKVESPYELVLVAKERAAQLSSGIEPTLDRDNDKNTVIALREIAEETVKVPDLSEAAIYKLRKHVEQVDDGSEDDEEIGDDFESLYKGEVSKEDLAELSQTATPEIDTPVSDETIEQADVSLDDVSASEEQVTDENTEDTDTSNS